MTSGLSTGVTTYCAPALMAASAVFSSSTLPTPTSALLPNSRVTSAMTCSAFGVVMVTSMPEMPPAMSARLASMSCSELSARMIATTPGVRRPSMIWSLVMGIRVCAYQSRHMEAGPSPSPYFSGSSPAWTAMTLHSSHKSSRSPVSIRLSSVSFSSFVPSIASWKASSLCASDASGPQLLQSLSATRRTG